jgi:hypothetical protein
MRDRPPPTPALSLGQKAFVEQLDTLLKAQGKLLGSGGKRLAYKVNAKGELVIAIIVEGIRIDG